MSEKISKYYRVKTIGETKYRAFSAEKVDFLLSPSSLYYVPFEIAICPVCGAPLLLNETYPIQVSNADCIFIKGGQCVNCDAFFSKDLLDKEKFFREYHHRTINKYFDFPLLTNYDREIDDCVSDFECVDSAFMMFYLMPLEYSGNIRVITIVYDEADADDEDDEIEEYVLQSSDTAKLLLKAKEDENTYVVLDHEPYRIVRFMQKQFPKGTDLLIIDNHVYPVKEAQLFSSDWSEIDGISEDFFDIEKDESIVELDDDTEAKEAADEEQDNDEKDSFVELPKDTFQQKNPLNQLRKTVAEESVENNDLSTIETPQKVEKMDNCDKTDADLPPLEMIFIYDNEPLCFAEHEIDDCRVNIIYNDIKYIVDVEYCWDCNEYMMSKESFEHILNLYHVFPVVTETMNSTFSTKSYKRYRNRREKSDLYLAGYNVSSSDDLSEKQRHDVLAFELDTRRKTKAEIVRFIQGLIDERINRPNMERAIEKWESDIKFVYNYQIKDHVYLESPKISLIR